LFHHVVCDIVDRQETIEKEVCYVSLQQTQHSGIIPGLDLRNLHNIEFHWPRSANYKSCWENNWQRTYKQFKPN